MELSKKSKCAGCSALNNKGNHYECYLGFGITFEGSGTGIHAPKPTEKCYKPTNSEELVAAKNRKEKLDSRL